MIPEFSGIERRLDELNERLARLEPFREKQRSDFEEDAYLRDIVERNLEIAAQCCIDISHRIISIEKAQKPDGVIEIEEGINIDVSSDGSIVGIEFIDAAKKMPLDSFLKYEIDGESIGLMVMMQRNKNNSPLSL